MNGDEDGAQLGRDEVIRSLASSLEGKDYILAFWEGGAAASGTLDRWSDLDLYLLVRDDKVEESFSDVEAALRALSEIGLKLAVEDTGWPGVHQAFYKLTGMSEYHVIDLAVVTLSAEEKFLEPTVHGEARFGFNKIGTIDYQPYDEAAARDNALQRRKRLSDRIDIFGSFFQKEVSRGNLIEAVDLYHRLVLSTLVQLLRMKYNLSHSDFGTRHVHIELPDEVVSRLVGLHFTADRDELLRKHSEARHWISELLSEPFRSGGSP